MIDGNSSHEENNSSSEEEVEDQGIVEAEEAALNEILEESERLDVQNSEKRTPKTRSGKERAKKVTKSEQETRLWEVISRIQEEMKSLKRSHTTNDDPQLDRTKRKKVETSPRKEAFDRPGSSRDRDFQTEEQLSAEESSTQLSSAQPSRQLRFANRKQLSPAETQPQLRPVRPPTVPRVQNDDAAEADADDMDIEIDDDDEVTLQVGDQNDPLARELQQDSGDEDSSEDEGNDQDYFDDMVNAIDIRGEDELPGQALNQTWAEKIDLAWKTKMSKSALTTLLTKYRLPSNLTELKVPKMNKEIWRLIGKWQRKADLAMSNSQRCLMKATAAALQLHEQLADLPRSTRQIGMQTTADIVSLLGKVNRELINKRKVTVRPCLLGDYKTLSHSTSATAENLFGDNLTQDIKDVQVKRKIDAYNNGRQFSRRGRGGNTRYQNSYHNYQQNYTSSNNGSFLWRGRGRGRTFNNYRASQYQHHGQKKN